MKTPGISEWKWSTEELPQGRNQKDRGRKRSAENCECWQKLDVTIQHLTLSFVLGGKIFHFYQNACYIQNVFPFLHQYETIKRGTLQTLLCIILTFSLFIDCVCSIFNLRQNKSIVRIKPIAKIKKIKLTVSCLLCLQNNFHLGTMFANEQSCLFNYWMWFSTVRLQNNKKQKSNHGKIATFLTYQINFFRLLFRLKKCPYEIWCKLHSAKSTCTWKYFKLVNLDPKN